MIIIQEFHSSDWIVKWAADVILCQSSGVSWWYLCLGFMWEIELTFNMAEIYCDTVLEIPRSFNVIHLHLIVFNFNIFFIIGSHTQ